MDTTDNDIEIPSSALVEESDICIHLIAKTDCRLCKNKCEHSKEKRIVRSVVVVVYVFIIEEKEIVRSVVVVNYVNRPFVRQLKTTDTMDIVLDVTSIYFPMNLFQKIIKQKSMLFWNL